MIKFLVTAYENTKVVGRHDLAVDSKINNAKPDALFFADGQGIFNRQFSSLMSMTNYLIRIKSNSQEKNAKHNSM
jgi:hypothetical protein